MGAELAGGPRGHTERVPPPDSQVRRDRPSPKEVNTRETACFRAWRGDAVLVAAGQAAGRALLAAAVPVAQGPAGKSRTGRVSSVLS